jgi:hypothetical protein
MARKDPFDPYELAVSGDDPETEESEPLLPGPRRTKASTLLIGFVAVVALVAVATRGRLDVPAIKASCTTPGFALAGTSVMRNGLLAWSAVGPTGATVVIGADTSTLPTTFAAGRLVGPAKLDSCQVHGRFSVPLPVGSHTLTVFLVDPAGEATVLGTKQLTVT